MKIGGKHLHTPIRYLFLEAVAELMGLMSGFGIFPRRLDYLICFFRRQKSVGVLWVIFFLGNYVRRTGTPVVESSIK